MYGAGISAVMVWFRTLQVYLYRRLSTGPRVTSSLDTSADCKFALLKLELTACKLSILAEFASLWHTGLVL